MKIDKAVKANLLNTIAGSVRTKTPKEKASASKQNVDASDKVELSGRNRDIAKLIAKANSAPSIRQDKVDSIKKAIQNGTYNVKGDLVAKAILKDNLLDEIL
ncbi:MAG: flagellar biosynthesis anti-sigma factor FlgM [Proteobacteria bacterium]|nr:flagellar biosynthesis anti-sigma factor FlgM [Pseudomonadota bacterium]